MLLTINSSGEQTRDFILLGFPGFQQWQLWISIPLALLLLVAVMANITLITTIWMEKSLHEPMYYFLCKLSLVDLALSLVITPKILAILWFHESSISQSGCFTQMFFVHTLVFQESSVLAAMAFDRYIAICIPLRYSSLLNNRLVGAFFIAGTGRSLACALPVPLLAARLHYCSDHLIKHCYCNNLAVTKLACDDISFNSRYQMIISNSLLWTDLMVIVLSYCLIVHAVVKLSVEGAITKAFNTCSSHLIIILIFYSALIVLAVTHHSEKEIVTHMVILLNVLHLTAPAALNPIIYGVRNKEIKKGICKQFSKR